MPSGHGRTWKVGGRRGEEVEVEEMGGARVNKKCFRGVSLYISLLFAGSNFASCTTFG